MASTQSARALLDKTWLPGSNGLLVMTRTRVVRDEKYAARFRLTVLDLFSELWPADPPVDEVEYLAAIEDDIDRIPADLIEDLVDALGRQASANGSAQSPENAAARVLAGWLRTRSIELHAEGPVLEQARRFKQDYPDLFRDLLVRATVPAHQIPAEAASGSARLDQI